MERLHATVRGHVQGVGFRATTKQQAQRLGLTGWVHNNPNGTVEVIAEGPRDALESLEAFLNQGPTAARVASVQPSWKNATGEFDNFRIR